MSAAKGPSPPPTATKPAASGGPGCLGRVLRYVLLALVIGMIVILVDGFQVKVPIGQAGTPARGEVVGVVHVHTRVSDGDGDINDVISAARWADLSFLAITDFNAVLDSSLSGHEKSNVLLVGGEEVSTSDGHFLALGVKKGWREGVPNDTAKLLAAAKKAGAARFIAHPYGNVKDWSGHAWDTIDDFDGIEVMNADAEWRDNNPGELAMSALIFTVNPDLALIRLVNRPEKTLAKWDELLRKRKVSGFCGADAHARVYLGYGQSVGFPAYLRVFRITRQHVLLGNGLKDGESPPRDARAIIAALKAGRSYCAVDGMSGASGLLNQVESLGAVAGPGESIAFNSEATMRVVIPPGSGTPYIKVFKDGHETFNQRGWRLDKSLTGPGVYRTEVWLRQPGITGGQRWTPWIMSNPIYVTAPVVPEPVERIGTPSPTPTPAPVRTSEPAHTPAPRST